MAVIHILLKETMTITGVVIDVSARRIDERNKELIIKNCA